MRIVSIGKQEAQRIGSKDCFIVLTLKVQKVNKLQTTGIDVSVLSGKKAKVNE